MTVQGINLILPPSLYQRLTEMAEASQKPLSDVLIQSIQTGMPPSLEHVPERFWVDLKTLSRLKDDVLFDVVGHELSKPKQKRYEELLTKNEQGILKDTSEKSELAIVREEADLLMFRRAYAAALLKWRGHRIKTLPPQ